LTPIAEFTNKKAFWKYVDARPQEINADQVVLDDFVFLGWDEIESTLG
jgi:hypothetical protein